MATKTPIQQLDPKLQKTMRDKVRSLQVEIKCQDCGKTISKRSISNINDTQNYKCPSKECGASFQADMSSVKEVLKEIERM